MAKQLPEDHAEIRFYLEAMPDPKASLAAGRPQFREVEMVRIMHAGDKDNTIIAPAHEPFMMGKNGEQIDYSERFPTAYAEFKAGRGEVMVGTPIEHLPFLNMGQQADLRAQGIRTAEMLKSLPDNRLKWGMRELRDQATVWLEEADKMAAVTREMERNAALTARIEALEKQLANPTGPVGASVKTDAFDAMDDGQLRQLLADNGVTMRANAARKVMLDAVRELMAGAE